MRHDNGGYVLAGLLAAALAVSAASLYGLPAGPPGYGAAAGAVEVLPPGYHPETGVMEAPPPGAWPSGPRMSGPEHVDVATAAAHGRHAPDQMTDKTVGVRALTNWNATKEEHRTEARARSGPNEGHDRATNTPDTYMFGATSADARRRDDPRRS